MKVVKKYKFPVIRQVSTPRDVMCMTITVNAVCLNFSEEKS